MLDTDFVVDAMGRSSRLSDWLNRGGFEQPSLERLAVPLNYATAAADFFELQDLVVDAAWTVSAGGDAARLDAQQANVVSEEARRQRWVRQQLLRAALTNSDNAGAFREVNYMLRHPVTLAEPALVERAVAVNAAA